MNISWSKQSSAFRGVNRSVINLDYCAKSVHMEIFENSINETSFYFTQWAFFLFPRPNSTPKRWQSRNVYRSPYTLSEKKSRQLLLLYLLNGQVWRAEIYIPKKSRMYTHSFATSSHITWDFLSEDHFCWNQFFLRFSLLVTQIVLNSCRACRFLLLRFWEGMKLCGIF